MRRAKYFSLTEVFPPKTTFSKKTFKLKVIDECLNLYNGEFQFFSYKGNGDIG